MMCWWKALPPLSAVNFASSILIYRPPINGSPPIVWLSAAARDDQITPPFPDMVIASGRQAVPHARFIKRASRGAVFTVFLQDPIVSPRHFDFVWAPAHDRCAGAMRTLLSPHGMTQDLLHTAADKMKARLLPDTVRGKKSPC